MLSTSRLTIGLLRTGALASLAASANAQWTFEDQADSLGVQVESFGRAVATVDIDGDGLLDIVAANDSMANSFFKQLPDHSFVDAALEWSAPQDSRPHRGLVVADFDGDGDPDIYTVNGVPATDNRMIRNDLSSGGGLVDITATAGDAALFAGNSFGSTALDYDRDGLLDIFVTNLDPGPCDLIHNDGELVFTEVSDSALLNQWGEYRYCGAADVNNDGWVDIGVGNFAGPNRLYNNNANGTFYDVASNVGVAHPGRNFGMVFADFDNDGWIDIFLPKYNKTPGPETKILLNQDGQGFEVALELGEQTAMGHNVADLDGDGFPDVYIGTGAPEFASRDLMFRVFPDGSGGLAAQDVSDLTGITLQGPTRCHGMGIGDLDDDGDLDIYVNNGGPANLPDTIEENFLWMNGGAGHQWAGLDLTGVFSNRTAIGAKAVAITDAGTEVHRLLSAGYGFGNTNSPTLNFGLGAESSIERYVVTWPSGIEQVVLTPPVGQRMALTETGLRFEGTAVPGATIEIDGCGPADALVSVFLSFSTDEIVSPEFGGLILLGLPAQLFGSFALDADGVGALAFDVPEDPGLIGLTGYFQGSVQDVAIAGATSTTNRVSITIE